MIDPRSLRPTWLNLAFVAGYVALDFLSGPEARHQATMPVWHPAAGLALFMLMQRGWRALPLLLAAATLASWTAPALPGQPLASLLVGLLPLPAYVLLARQMQRSLSGGAFLASHQAMLHWICLLAAASVFSGLLYACVLTLGEVDGLARGVDELVRFAIGETAGMLVVVPLAWALANDDARTDFLARVLTRETVGYTALIALVVPAAMQHPAGDSIAYYFLFLPLAWAAARQGMPGAMAAAVALEAGVTAAALLPGSHAERVAEVQMPILTLILAGFLIGVAVDVARRASNELRQSLRLAAAGEMAAALAHELNQPLTALSAYGSACEHMLRQGRNDDLLQKTIRAMAAESQRAAEVLKRLREFFRTGSTELETVELASLVAAATRPFIAKAPARGIDLSLGAMPHAVVLCDRVQLEIVLRNLLSNAFQALEEVHDGGRRVRVSADLAGECVRIRIADNGPGIAGQIRPRLFEPFVSHKSSGLGLGLAISRSIIETHGGSLVAEPGPHGVLTITLPVQATQAEVTRADA